MKTLITAAALAALAFTGAQAGEAQLVKASGQTVVTDAVTGETYVISGKRYPRVREAWVAPPGWTQRVYVVGEAIPADLLRGPYVITDYRRFGLPRPKGDEKWIRVGPDVLLVRVGTGNVLMRIENVFY
jgi:Ni/Co efflux regulator RcnB